MPGIGLRGGVLTSFVVWDLVLAHGFQILIPLTFVDIPCIGIWWFMWDYHHISNNEVEISLSNSHIYILLVFFISF
jgi:hypothetical protein